MEERVITKLVTAPETRNNVIVKRRWINILLITRANSRTGKEEKRIACQLCGVDWCEHIEHLGGAGRLIRLARELKP